MLTSSHHITTNQLPLLLEFRQLAVLHSFFLISLCFCQALFCPFPITCFFHFSIMFIACILSLPSSSPTPAISPPSAVSLFSFYSQKPSVSPSLSLSHFLDSQDQFFSPVSLFVCQLVIHTILQWTGCTLPLSLSTTLGISLTYHSPLVDTVSVILDDLQSCFTVCLPFYCFITKLHNN